MNLFDQLNQPVRDRPGMPKGKAPGEPMSYADATDIRARHRLKQPVDARQLEEANLIIEERRKRMLNLTIDAESAGGVASDSETLAISGPGSAAVLGFPNAWKVSAAVCEALNLLIAGKTKEEASEALGITTGNFDSRMFTARKKLGVDNNQAALELWARWTNRAGPVVAVEPAVQVQAVKTQRPPAEPAARIPVFKTDFGREETAPASAAPPAAPAPDSVPPAAKPLPATDPAPDPIEPHLVAALESMRLERMEILSRAILLDRAITALSTLLASRAPSSAATGEDSDN